jgi:hypothetical protein
MRSAEPVPRAGFAVAAKALAGPVSLWKNEGKKRSRRPVRGWFGGPRYAI